MSDYKQLSLREAAKFDFDNKLKEKLTGWGIICKMRAELKMSRKARARARNDK